MFAPAYHNRLWFWLAVAGLLGCAPTLPAQVPTAYKTATPALTAQMYMESMYLPSATTGPWAPAWSPDGKSLVFSMYGSLWVVPAAGGQAVQITAGPGYDSEPAWSPDGARIVFTKDTGHAMELWLVNADGSSPGGLTANSGINVDPEWHSSDTIFFTSSLGGSRFGIWQIAAGGGEPSPVLADKEQNIEPASSPDGKYVVLISSRQDFANPGSPVFARMSYGSGDLWKLALADKKLELLDREETLWQARPRWSPDGRKIVYVSYRTGSNQLWLLDPETGIPVQLTDLKDAEAFTPAWSPDSRFLAFVTNGDQRFTLWTMPAVGGQPREVRITSLRYRQPMGRLQATVLDESGKPTPARVYLVAADGRNWAPANSFQRESVITGDDYFESGGRFSVQLPAGTAAIEAVKGFEYQPARQSVQVRQGGTATVVLRLKRMTDLAASGWVSGDNHMHMNYGGVFRETPASLMTEIEAEDLNVLNAFPTNNQNRLLDMQYFIGRPDPRSTANNILYFNEEYRPNFAGHLDLLNLKRLFFPVYDGYPGTPFAADYPSNAQVLDSIHRQGGIGGYAHPYLIPRGEDPSQADFSGAREFPADAALGKIDFYDLMCIWTDKYVAAEVWYRLLNLGFRVPISSGSDVMTNYWRAPTVGSVRVYVHAGPKPTYPGFIDAMLKGRGFVTNGPLVSFTVDGKEPGGQIDLPAGGAPLEIKAEAWSLVPMDQLDIIENGKVVYSGKPGDAKHLRIATTLPAEGSAWIAARVTGPSAQHLLMDSYGYAHTDPVYIRVAGRPLRSPEDARYFIRWMDRSLELINQRTFDNPEEKQQVRDVYQQARARFVQLAGGSAQGPDGTSKPSRNH
ncbi:MAG TPA: CehA/McbA family metallohydrolase [Candidatus Acidoferrales bacterium]|nr:CehA/McbA family metallohydrolase [Candidatus Acidoferrales bacterium]